MHRLDGDDAQMSECRRERAAGAAVRGPEGWLVIRDRWGCWTLPKGKIDPGETPREAALREIEEETGISAHIEQRLDEVTYSFWRRGRLQRKLVVYYLATTRERRLTPNMGEVEAARWVSANEFLLYCDYDNNEAIFRLALRMAHEQGDA